MIEQETIQALRDLNASNGMDATLGGMAWHEGKREPTWATMCNILADDDPESRIRRMRRVGVETFEGRKGAGDVGLLNDMADAIVERMRHMMEIARRLRDEAADIACDEGYITGALAADIRKARKAKPRRC